MDLRIANDLPITDCDLKSILCSAISSISKVVMSEGESCCEYITDIVVDDIHPFMELTDAGAKLYYMKFEYHALAWKSSNGSLLQVGIGHGLDNANILIADNMPTEVCIFRSFYTV